MRFEICYILEIESRYLEFNTFLLQYVYVLHNTLVTTNVYILFLSQR